MQNLIVRPGQMRLNPIVENGVLQRIVDEVSGAEISSPYGVKLSDEVKDQIKLNKVFEAIVSMEILDHPGEIGRYLDLATMKLSNLLRIVATQDEIGGLKVRFNGQDRTLKEVFTATTFNPLSAASDQIGRMPQGRADSVHDWLTKELNSLTGRNNFKRVLTKVKAISAFGTTIWQLLSTKMQINFFALRQLFAAANIHAPTERASKFYEFSRKTRTPLFDDPITRARSERMPMINGQPICGIYSNAAEHGLGFGQVVQSSMIPQETETLRALLDQPGRNSQINAIPRQAAPILDLNRPFMLSEEEARSIPENYEKPFNVTQNIAKHYFNHGVGINRWQPYGLYGTRANLAGFPSAGAQSGGTADVMLGLQMLSCCNIYSQQNERPVEAITLAVAAFMNFGGYHTVSEVLPVGKSVTRNAVFDPVSVAEGFASKRLYDALLASYKQFNVHDDVALRLTDLMKIHASRKDARKNA